MRRELKVVVFDEVSFDEVLCIYFKFASLGHGALPKEGLLLKELTFIEEGGKHQNGKAAFLETGAEVIKLFSCSTLRRPDID